MGHEGEDWPGSSYDPYVEEPFGAEAERVLGILESRLKSHQHIRCGLRRSSGARRRASRLFDLKLRP